MAITTDPWDSTELAAYISEVWPGLVNEEFFEDAVASNFFLDLSQFVARGSDIIHIPNAFTNSFTANTQATQGNEVTTEAPATEDDTLTVGTHKYVATLLGYMDQVQVADVYNLSEIYNRKARGTLITVLEQAIFGLHSSVSTNTVNDTASVVSDVDIRLAIEKLDTGLVPLDEVAFFFHPYTYWAQLHAIQKYYDASQAGWARDATSMIRSGNFGVTGGTRRALRGQLFGIPVFSSANVVNTLLAVKNLLAHKTALAFAIQTRGGNFVQAQAANWLENLGVLVVWDIIYGVGELREEAAVLINGSNAFIGS